MAESPQEVVNFIPAAIIVQGGGYSSMLWHLTDEYKKATKESAKEGYATLMNGGTAVDAVEAAVRVFENNEYFNAARGSLLNDNGEVECDAMIMEGNTSNAGAVISGRHFRNPVSLARKIMDHSHHCALSGDGAFEFAQAQDIPTCDPSDLITQQRFKIHYESVPDYVTNHYTGEPVKETQHHQTYDTVSAVAMDSKGHLACAASTGGIAGKLKGRVGDVPMIGCGGYANKSGGATTTGHGETLLKLTLAREVVYYMENELLGAQESAEKAVRKMNVHDPKDGYGGVIAIDNQGNFGKDFNTAAMVWASIKENRLEFGMESKEVSEFEHVSGE